MAFNTSSGLPVTYVPLRDAAGRAKSGMSDANTNIAEAGTISMEFTSIGRLLGKALLVLQLPHTHYVRTHTYAPSLKQRPRRHVGPYGSLMAMALGSTCWRCMLQVVPSNVAMLGCPCVFPAVPACRP